MNKSFTNKAVETRDRITHVAEQLFTQKGYNGTTLREIATKAQVTTGAFYKYYKSKEEILIEIFNEGFKKQWEHFYDLADDFTPADYAKMVGQMNKGLATTFGFELLKVYCTAQWDMGNQGSLWKVLDSEKYGQYDQVLLERMAAKYSTKYNSSEIDDIILKVDRGVLLDWIIKKGEYDIEEATTKLLLIVFRDIFDLADWK